MKNSSKIEILSHKKAKPDWELIHSEHNTKVDRLLEIYKESPYHAGIIFRSDKQGYTLKRIVAFTFANGDMNIITFQHSHGISVTNKKYKSEKVLSNIIYKVGTNKWYFKYGSLIRHLTITDLINTSNCVGCYNFKGSELYKFLVVKIGWLRNLVEENSLVTSLTVNLIITHKLYNKKAVYRYLFGVPYSIAEIFMSNNINYNYGNYHKMIKELKKCLINIENLKEELFKDVYFMDTCKMAGILGKKVNCSWSSNRLKLEHNKYSKEVTQVLNVYEEIRVLKVKNIFKEFAKYSNFRILGTNHELIEDGMKMNHCVGSYSSSVDQGYCGIYKVEEYTLELQNRNNKLVMVQLRGYHNELAPEELCSIVDDYLDSFNLEILPKLVSEVELISSDDLLPF